MSKEAHSGRENAAKKSSRENHITAGAIETPVEGFMGDITRSAPFRATYGNHKRMGSEMAPMKAAGRGGAGKDMRSKLMGVIFKTKGVN